MGADGCHRRFVDTSDQDGGRAGTEWWSELTERSGEGMMVKPLDGGHVKHMWCRYCEFR